MEVPNLRFAYCSSPTLGSREPVGLYNNLMMNGVKEKEPTHNAARVNHKVTLDLRFNVAFLAREHGQE